VRAFEREPKETNKAYGAFCIYRDLGPERSLAKAAETYYGSSKNLAQIGLWSRKFDWVERARAFDDWLLMRDRVVIEEFQNSKAAKFAERQMALREKLLANAEKAADQAAKMLDWPLTEQRMIREGDNGEEITMFFLPAGWNKQTAQTMHNIAASAVAGTWSAKQIEEGEVEEYDFEDLTEEEVMAYIEISEKLAIKKRKRP